MIPGIPAGRLLGAPLRIGLSWVFIVPLVGIALFAGIPADAGPVWGRGTVAAVGTVAVFLSVLLHEAAHVAVARVLSIPVAGVRVFFVGGCSDIDLDGVPARSETAVAAAGPVTSAVLALVIGGVGVVAPDVAGWHRVAGMVVLVNLGLSALNLLPVLPLDGGRVLRGMLRAAGWSTRRTERVVVWSAGAIGVALTVTGFVAAIAGRSSSLVVAPAGMLTVLLAVGARPSPIARVGDLMRPVAAAVGEAEAVAERRGSHLVPVARGTRVVGLLRPGAAGLAGEAMQPVGPGDVVDVSADLEEVRRRFATGPRPLLVTDGGRLVGVVVPEDVAALPPLP